MYVQKTPWVVTLWSPCEEAANTRGRQEERREFQSCWKTTSSVKLEAADLQTTCWKNRLRPSLARSSQCFATYRLKLNWCCSVSLWNNKLTPECEGERVCWRPRGSSHRKHPRFCSVCSSCLRKHSDMNPHAHLTHAHLTRAHLTHAYLGRAHLRRAHLRRAHLSVWESISLCLIS